MKQLDYELGNLNRYQQRHKDEIVKYEKDIDLNSIITRVPAIHLFQRELDEALEKCENMFEQTKIKRSFEQKRRVLDHLVQVQFQVTNIPHSFPIYYETIYFNLKTGYIVENTVNTIIETSLPRIFIGWIHRGESFLNMQEDKCNLPIEIDPINISKYQNGEFNLAHTISNIRHGHGTKVLKDESEGIAPINKLLDVFHDRNVIKKLDKLHLLFLKEVKAIDSNKKIAFGTVTEECIGTILPIDDRHVHVQLADFNDNGFKQLYQAFDLMLTLYYSQ